MLLGWQRICSRIFWDRKVNRKIFMRATTKRNFSSAKYGRFIWAQGKRNWSFTRATKKKGRCCADLCCDWDTFGPRWECSFQLRMAQRCGASSLILSSFLCTVLSWAFPSYMLKFDFSLLFKILFGCWQFSSTLRTLIAYFPLKASGEGGLVQIWTPNQQLRNHNL